jgi:secreted Zn-dependent insulinase-like peptidase
MESSLGTFLSTQQSVLKALTQTEVSSLCESLIKSLLDPPTTYTEESSTYWSALLNHMPFDWTQQVVDELKNVTVDDVIHTADKILFDHNSRKSVSVMLFGNAHRDELKKMQMKNEQSEISVEGELKTSSGSVDEEVVEGAFFRPEDRKVLYSLEELTGFRNALKLSGQGDGAKK